MDTWTRQTGFPVVNVTYISDKEYKLTQRIFLIDPDNVPTQSEYKSVLFIEIFYDDNTIYSCFFFIHLGINGLFPSHIKYVEKMM